MNGLAARLPRDEMRRLVAAGASLLLLSGVLGSLVNTFRPASSRLPWVGDWDHYIETLAFQANVPVAFLNSVRTRLDDSATVFADARSPADYAAGHIPGALSLPVGDLDRTIIRHAARLAPETPILVYCGGSDCHDALELALKLRDLGFSDLTLYPGGFSEWNQYGGAVHTGENP